MDLTDFSIDKYFDSVFRLTVTSVSGIIPWKSKINGRDWPLSQISVDGMSKGMAILLRYEIINKGGSTEYSYDEWENFS